MSEATARGAIVAAVNDAGEPFVGIVARSETHEDGDDRWLVTDLFGDGGWFRADDVVVVDAARMEDLRHALDAHHPVGGAARA